MRDAQGLQIHLHDLGTRLRGQPVEDRPIADRAKAGNSDTAAELWRFSVTGGVPDGRLLGPGIFGGQLESARDWIAPAADIDRGPAVGQFSRLPCRPHFIASPFERSERLLPRARVGVGPVRRNPERQGGRRGLGQLDSAGGRIPRRQAGQDSIELRHPLFSLPTVMRGNVGHLEDFGIFALGRREILLADIALRAVQLRHAAQGGRSIALGGNPAIFRAGCGVISAGQGRVAGVEPGGDAFDRRQVGQGENPRLDVLRQGCSRGLAQDPQQHGRGGLDMPRTQIGIAQEFAHFPAGCRELALGIENVGQLQLDRGAQVGLQSGRLKNAPQLGLGRRRLVGQQRIAGRVNLCGHCRAHGCQGAGMP